MDVKELEAKLQLLRVHPNCYSLDGTDKDEAVILCRDASGWAVYYSERGQRSDFRRFPSMGDAREEVLQMLAADPTARIGTEDLGAIVATWKRWKL